MRRFICLSIIAISFCAFQRSNAVDVTTIPVGFNTATITPAVDATHPSSTVVSAPFYAVADFQGAVSSVDSSNQITITGLPTPAPSPSPGGQFLATPHLARLKTGASTGRFFIITGHSGSQLTLDTATAGYTLTTGSPSTTQAQVVAGDSVEVLSANTLGTLFGAGSVPFGTGATANVADDVYLFNGASWDVYFHNGTNWRKSGSGLNQNNTVVLPDRGMFIVRRGTGALSLTFLGTVPSTTERTDFPGAGSSFRANRFPVDTTLVGLGLHSQPTWQQGSSASAADNLYLWDSTNQNWNVYYYNGTNWKKSGSGLNQNTTVIPLGTAMFVVRQSTAVGSNSTLVQTLPYTL